MHAAFLGLRQCNLHDFFSDALDLDIHLQRGNAICRTSNLEIHVAQMILIAQNVGQHGKLAAILDQSHRNTGNMRFHGNTSIHQCKATTAY